MRAIVVVVVDELARTLRRWRSLMGIRWSRHSRRAVLTSVPRSSSRGAPESGSAES